MPHSSSTSIAASVRPSPASKSRSINAIVTNAIATVNDVTITPTPPTLGSKGKEGSKYKGKASKVHVNAKEALEAAAQTTEDHLYAKKTKTSYKGQVSRALAYAAAATDPGWKEAFIKVSSLTPTVLLAYFASKCQEEGEGLSYKTAEGIKSGLKHYFRTELGCLGDTWACDKDGNCTGNPVHEAVFENYLQSLKNRDGRAGTSRQSLAMTYNDMVLLMKHLQDPKTTEEKTEGVCLLFQAFAATGFTLWTR
ncbi:hypothetical protein BGX23_002574 [Mortierella sp. AD031]|nr:hypothetical protein BGX23_002574 [Mortierella sp. AD031]